METTKLKRFAQYARRSLLEQVTAKLKLVLSEDSAARRESPEAVKKLEEAIQKDTKDQVIERVAYIWFNRFCALRFMDVNRYNRVGIVSPADPGQFQPEILAEAKMGHIDDMMVADKVRQQIVDLLGEKIPSHDPQGEAYRLLVVAACNSWNKAMPFLFERIEDYTELLMPDDLLSGNSILAYTREAMTPDTCQNVEVIGWLYQFYISEKKDAVIGKVVKSEDIPAATQLFTPNWIVKYLVQNSIGRLWTMASPNTKLKAQWDYYIEPAEQSPDVQEKLNALIQSRMTVDGDVLNPENITVLDPACGSGHILVEAYDVLKAIYEEQGYEPRTIPRLILEKNLYGLDIDDRAAQLAGFALLMKARADDRRIFVNPPKLNILALVESGNCEAPRENAVLEPFYTQLIELFKHAKTFGSLIQIPANLAAQLPAMEAHLRKTSQQGDLLSQLDAMNLLPLVEQAKILAMQFDAVIANPPYMGGKGMNPALKDFAKKHFPDSKSDLFAMFIERGFGWCKASGFNAQVTMQSWMFLSSYEAMREKLLNNHSLISLLQMPYDGKSPTVMGINFGVTSFVFQNTKINDVKGDFDCFRYFELTEDGSPKKFPSQNERNVLAKPDDFKKISGSPVAYWVSEKLRNSFVTHKKISDFADTRSGLITGDNQKYIRYWQEVEISNIGLNLTRESAKTSGLRWFPQSKGGDFRRWYGNNETVVDWLNDGTELQTQMHSSGERILAHNFNLDKIFQSAITWTKLSSGQFSARLQPSGFIFGDASANAFVDDENNRLAILGFLGTKLPAEILKALNPTLNFLPGNISNLPIAADLLESNLLHERVLRLISIAKTDWNNYETSWDFLDNPLIRQKQPTLKAAFEQWQTQNRAAIVEMKRLEEENNRLFIEAYGLQDELSPDVPEEQITLVRADLEKDCRDFISYAVGCLFGRYSLDKTGLILASQGEMLDDYLKHIPEPTLMPCENNVLPIIDGDWFADDLSERFREFLRVSFGEAHYAENLHFIEESLGKKIGQYFVKDFYNDHIKRYKKRPIYWLFSSPKGSFNALIYLHRYRADTVSVVLNEYLREFRTKLSAQKSHLEAISISSNASQSEKTKALKEIEKMNKMIAELEEYEREVLYPLATEQKVIDLDDGVKVNYGKFGTALKKIAGLDAQDD